MYLFVNLALFFGTINYATSIWCYRCVSTQPGCSLFDFDIRIYWGHYCPDPNDKCVKIIEQRGADIRVIRDCLSSIEGPRRDIPADHYEGCRPAAQDPFLGHYTNNSIPELNIRRHDYDEALFCFCDFDERCNSAGGLKISFWVFSFFLSISGMVSYFLV